MTSCNPTGPESSFTAALLFQVSQKELKEALRRQWSQLSDKRRLKWISKALELQKDYEVPRRLDRTGPGQAKPGSTELDQDRLNQTELSQAQLDQTEVN